MKLNFQMIDRIKIKVIALIWVFGLVLIYGAISSLMDIWRLPNGGGQTANVPRVERVAMPLPASEVADIARNLSLLYPSVKIEALKNGNLRIAIFSPAQYSEWRSAIYDLMQSGSIDTVFETVSICGAGCEGMYCGAEFSAKNVRYAVRS